MTTIFVYDLTPRSEQYLSEGWMIPVFVLCLLGFAWVRVNYGRRVPQLFSNLLNVRLMRQTMREELVLTHRASLVFSSMFVLQVSLLFYLLNVSWSLQTLPGSGLAFYGKAVVLVILIYTIKLLGIQIVQWVTMSDYSLSEYTYNIFLMNKIMGILLFPILLCTIFVDTASARILLWAAAGVVVILFLYRLIRGMLTAITQGVSPVYIILYLCTLEILPLLLLFKVVGF
ncbi:MAG: DUF4271 domain-containing protein [Flavobacteriales bacterium]|nr:DUF4271 domain-containing protein [Flavobacteriales bacterium]